MKPFRLASLLTLLALAVALQVGCIFSPGTKTNTQPPAIWLSNTSVENVISNIKNAYNYRDVAHYDSCLAQNYTFKFTAADISHGSPDSLIRNEEVLFADHLFATGKPESGLQPATKISLTVDITNKGPTDRINAPRSEKKYIVQTRMTLDFADGSNQQTVDSPATWYFDQQPDSSGHWYLAMWQDIGSSTSPARLAAVNAGTPRPSSWAALHRNYR